MPVETIDLNQSSNRLQSQQQQQQSIKARRNKRSNNNNNNVDDDADEAANDGDEEAEGESEEHYDPNLNRMRFIAECLHITRPTVHCNSKSFYINDYVLNLLLFLLLSLK